MLLRKEGGRSKVGRRKAGYIYRSLLAKDEAMTLVYKFRRVRWHEYVLFNLEGRSDTSEAKSTWLRPFKEQYIKATPRCQIVLESGGGIKGADKRIFRVLFANAFIYSFVSSLQLRTFELLKI